MENIQFYPVEVRGISNEIVSSKENIEDLVNRLNNTIVNNLCANWDGVASDKYRNEFENLKSQVMDKFVVMLEDLHVQLDSISNVMQQADNDIASKISMQ